MLLPDYSDIRGNAVIVLDEVPDFKSVENKTWHGLIRFTERFRVQAAIDVLGHFVGRDAGELLDGRHRGIPIFGSINQMLNALGHGSEEGENYKPDYLIVGGPSHPEGTLSPAMYQVLRHAIIKGISIISLSHSLISTTDLGQSAKLWGTKIYELRAPRPISQYSQVDPAIFSLDLPVIAYLGTDCAVGKRTAAQMLVSALNGEGFESRMIWTGETGFLQSNHGYGLIVDSTPYDFVAGGLVGSILRCAREVNPRLIVLEGQSSIRNPTASFGTDFLNACCAKGVVLQHAPTRQYYDGLEGVFPMRDLAQEIQVIELLGAPVIAVTLNTQGLTQEQATTIARDMQEQLGRPVLIPFDQHQDLQELCNLVQDF